MLSLSIIAALLLLGGPAAASLAPSPLDTLTVYDGNWIYTTAANPSKPDHLTNHCHMDDAYYTCEQVLNGKPVALLVFTAGDTPGVLHSQVVLPTGNAVGRGSDLTIAGNHWTFLSKDSTGTTYRVENIIRDHDHIHSEQYKSTDGIAWQKTGEGDEVRTDKP
jgi:hypothetical protein